MSDHDLPNLSELLVADDLRILADAAVALEVELSLVGCDGRPLLGTAIDCAVAERTAHGPLLVDGRCWIARVAVEGTPVGLSRVTATDSLGERSHADRARHLERLLGHLAAAGLERCRAARQHREFVATTDAELQRRNARLAAAVERLQDLDRLRSSFLATISHELRTPLTSILGYAEMLLDGLAGTLAAEQRDWVRTIYEKGEQLHSIINSILDVSRIEADGVRLDRSTFSAEELTDQALRSVAGDVDRKGLRLRKTFAAGLPPVVADRGKLLQVLLNLLGNAIKFTPALGEVAISLEAGGLRRPCAVQADAPRDAVRIMVADSGIGIAPDCLHRIFDPFFQVEATATREHNGTGVGLAIVRSFILAHGGAVWVESVPGEGSRFFVTVPAARQP